MTEAQKRIVFCMEWMPSYRRAFYEQLEPKLAEVDIAMTVVHGLPPASRSQRRDHSEPFWATLVPNRVLTVRNIELTWQPVWEHAKGADLIIAQQEAANLFNYYAMARRRLGGPKVALWGHGENPDPGTANPAAERLKASTTRFADWFFAYTERSASIVQTLGFPASRVTVVNNSRSLDRLASRSPDADPEIRQLCTDVNARSEHIGWMASALDESKRLPFLVETLDAVRERIPDFEFFVLGRGPQDSAIFEAAESRRWLHAVGARFGADKVAIGDVADLTIHPGLLGLHVVDAFGFETPIITTDFVSHSHEFDYLEHERNALVLSSTATPDALAAAIERYFSDPNLRAQLKDGCRTSARRFSLDAMTDRFADGVQGALRG